MQTPKITIIIPFYNVENYIEECIKSVVNQTIKDIEIIFVNDGSTDNSLSIVQNYMNNDERIKLINVEKRKGQGFARNKALEIAKGDYIGFVDSDDYVSMEMFEKLYTKATQNNNDITMCLAQELDDKTKSIIESDFYSLVFLKKFENNVFSAEETKDTVLNINVAIWNKLYNHSFLKEISAKFPEGYIYEDLPFFFSTFLLANRIQVIWEHLYIYRINRNASTMNQFGNKVLDRIPMVSLTYEKIKRTPFFKEIKKDVQAWIINDLFHRYTLLEMGYHKEFFFAMKKLFVGLDIENVNDSYWKKIFHFEGYKLVLNNTFETFNQKVFHDYVNIHNVQDRIVSEADGKIKNEATKVYRELDKLYDRLYFLEHDHKRIDKEEKIDPQVEKIAIELNKKIEDLNNFAVSKNKDFLDDLLHIKSDIHCLYNDISKTYQHNEQKREELKSSISSHFEEKFRTKLQENENEIKLLKENNKKLQEELSVFKAEVKKLLEKK